jgi:hypothetical protein
MDRRQESGGRVQVGQRRPLGQEPVTAKVKPPEELDHIEVVTRVGRCVPAQLDGERGRLGTKYDIPVPAGQELVNASA